MTERALSFGSVAGAYERFRLDYPDDLASDVLGYAGRAVGTALEIGAGTGKATRVFARRGIAVTATDPDPAMLAELRRHVPASVTVVRAAFEELPLGPGYDLVFAAASLHWTRPQGRWSRVAAMLARGGIFASFGGQLHLADPDVDQAVRAARSPFLSDDDVPPPDGMPTAGRVQWPGTELAASDWFTDVREFTIRRRASIPARDYLGYLSTVSAYLMLPAPTREQLLGRIHEVLPRLVAIEADIAVHVARLARHGADDDPGLRGPRAYRSRPALPGTSRRSATPSEPPATPSETSA